MTLPPLHTSQIQVQRTPSRFKTIAAGRRWGKGVLGIGESVRRASQGQHCWWIAPTFSSAAYQAGWRMLEFYAARVPGARIHMQRRAMMLGEGWVQFKTAEEPDALRGESIDFVVVDEAAHIPQLKQIWELCLRPCLLDRKGDAWFISTPAGYNYFYELWKRGQYHQRGWASFQFSSHTNPYLDKDELAEIVADMPALVKRQEIDAEFVQLAGALFRRENVIILEQAPAGVRWVRSWDLAFTEKTTSDFTAGAKVGLDRSTGTVIVAHMVAGRMEWPEAVRCIADTARLDGRQVRQGVECVGAQVGMLQTLLRDPLLVSYSFQPIEVHKDKLTRALPLVARSEQHKFAVVRGPWVQPYLDQLCSFPESDYDDQVDATTGAWTMIETPSGAWSSTDLPPNIPRSHPGDDGIDMSAYEADLSVQ